MTYNEALQKAAKLLRLSKSSNQHEAALAASRAQEIIDRYKIEAEALALDGKPQEPDEPIKDFGSDPLERLNRKSAWKSRLASIIAKHNSCKMYNGWYGPAVIGRPSDVATVRYMYAWLRQEIDRLAERDCKGNGTIYANNYRFGVTDTISNRLYEQQKATREAVRKEAQQLAQTQGQNETAANLALVRVDQAIAKVEQRREQVEAWTKEHVKLVSSRSSCRYDGSARSAGQRAGNEIRLRPAKAHIA